MSGSLFLSWSGGKDCCLALYRSTKKQWPIRRLLTSVSEVHDRVSMHGVRSSLLKAQAASLGLPLDIVPLPDSPGMTPYETAMNAAYAELKQQGFDGAVFGDIFLEDLRTYREEQLAKQGLQCHFPIWQQDSRSLVKEFIEAGFKAVVVCVNGGFLDQSFCGRLIDEDFINDLPPGVDPCGENGEYHSFVYDGPLFSAPVQFSQGEITCREYPAPRDKNETCFTAPRPAARFYFQDLL